MTQETLDHDEQTDLFIPDLKRGAVLALILLGGLLAGMALVMWVQQTVHPYHPLVFEEAAREALEKEDFRRVVTICTGNLNYTGQHFPTHGTAYLLRAKAHWNLDRARMAAEDIARAESRWRAAFRSADTRDRHELKEFSTQLGVHFLEAGNTEQALRLFSLAGIGSAEPLAYIDELRGMLTDEMAAAIWPEEPYLIVEDFERPDSVLFAEWDDTTGRTVEITRVAVKSAETGQQIHAAHVTADSALQEGRSWYYIPLFMRIPDRSCRIRATIMVKEGPPPVLSPYRYYPEINTRRIMPGEAPFLIEGNRYAAEARFPSESGSDETGGCIIRIRLTLPSEACDFLVERIEVVPHDAEEGNGNGQG